MEGISTTQHVAEAAEQHRKERQEELHNSSCRLLRCNRHTAQCYGTSAAAIQVLFKNIVNKTNYGVIYYIDIFIDYVIKNISLTKKSLSLDFF